MLAGVFAVRSGREAAGQRDTARAAEQEAQVQRDGAQAAQQAAQEERDNARAAQREAQDQRESAELDALVSRSLALRSSNRTLAALLAVEAHRRRPDAAAWSALLATFTATPNFQGYQYLPAERFVTGTLVPGTSNAVVALDGFDLVLVDLVTGEIDKRFAQAPDGLLTYSGLRVSGDGRFVAQLIEVPADAATSTLVVYDVATGQVVFGPFTPPFFAADVALNTDGSLVALAGGPNGDLAVYRLADGQPVGTLLGIARPQGINLNRETAALEFGVDGHLYWGSILGPIRVVDVSAMQVVHTYEAPLLSSNNQIIVTSSGLLVAAGDEAAVAVDITTSSIRWTMARQPGSNACSSIAVAEGSGHFYCRNTLSTGAGQNIGRVGRLEERDLTTGLPTGISFDPQQGTAGDVGVTADERELVTFSHNAPLISRWRLDGSGAVVTRVGQQRGRISGGFDPTGTMMLLADQPRPSLWIQETGTGPQDRADDRYVWDPNVDQMIDPLDGIAMARWAGTPGRLLAVFEDRTIGMHDVATRSRVEGVTIEPLDSRLTTFGRSVDNSRFYLGYLDGRIQTFDSTSGKPIGPIIQAGGVFGSITASAHGARVITTTFRNQEWSMAAHDATTGQPVGDALPDLNAAEVGPDDTVVAATIAGDITEFDLDTLQQLGSYPGARGLINSITFSADGAVLTARSFDGTLSIYDVPSRTRIGDPIQGTGAVRADGRAVAINDDDNGVAIWDINPEHLATAACRLAGRNLTAAEWDTHLAALGEYRSTCPQFS